MTYSVRKNLFQYYFFFILRNILCLKIEINISFFYIKENSVQSFFFLSLKLRTPKN